MSEFDDIMKLSRPVSKKHPPMPRINRAAQFGAFRALSGYEESIEEEGRLTDLWLEIDPVRTEEINRRMNEVKAILDLLPTVTVIYFVPDNKKDGGEYVTHTGKVRIIDDTLKVLTFYDGTRIDFSSIFDFKYKKED